MSEAPLSDFDTPESDFDVATVESVLGGVVPAKKQARDPAYKKLAADTRALTYQQRVFIRTLLTCAMNMRAATRKMRANGFTITQGTPVRWMKTPAFRSVVERYTDLMCAEVGIGSPQHIMLRINDVVENALEPVPMYHSGMPVMNPETGTVQKEVDRGSALKGLELLGKHAGAFRSDEEQSNRVTVVLDFSGESMQGEQESERVDAIDGEFEETK
ncbi:MAG: hypothetical protein LLG14_27575 [Nocardiaceae bacterium]|nr:hypothetical protein [Nocardiaceae bacterium]